LCLCNNAIYEIASNGSGHRRLTLPSRGQRIGPAWWSPDGKRIAFERQCVSTRLTHYDLCDVGFISALGADQTPEHARIAVFVENPLLWTADGKVLAVGRGRRVIEIDPTTATSRAVDKLAGAWTLASTADRLMFATWEYSPSTGAVLPDRTGIVLA